MVRGENCFDKPRKHNGVGAIRNGVELGERDESFFVTMNFDKNVRV